MMPSVFFHQSLTIYLLAEHRGYFFSTIKSNPDKFVKKCPKDIIDWLIQLKHSGKITFLITQSHVDYTKFLMNYALG